MVRASPSALLELLADGSKCREYNSFYSQGKPIEMLDPYTKVRQTGNLAGREEGRQTGREEACHAQLVRGMAHVLIWSVVDRVSAVCAGWWCGRWYGRPRPRSGSSRPGTSARSVSHSLSQSVGQAGRQAVSQSDRQTGPGCQSRPRPCPPTPSSSTSTAPPCSDLDILGPWHFLPPPPLAAAALPATAEAWQPGVSPSPLLPSCAPARAPGHPLAPAVERRRGGDQPLLPPPRRATDLQIRPRARSVRRQKPSSSVSHLPSP